MGAHNGANIGKVSHLISNMITAEKVSLFFLSLDTFASMTNA